MNMIQEMARAAINQVNQRAEEILENQRYEHWFRMGELDFREEQESIKRQVKEELHPHETIEQWWLSQSDASRDMWHEIYQERQYGHGESLADDNYFGLEVMAYLRKQDAYLKKPFCPWCDSRGHESGDCIRSAAQP